MTATNAISLAILVALAVFLLWRQVASDRARKRDAEARLAARARFVAEVSAAAHRRHVRAADAVRARSDERRRLEARYTR